jgi:hypothetical protein
MKRTNKYFLQFYDDANPYIIVNTNLTVNGIENDTPGESIIETCKKHCAECFEKQNIKATRISFKTISLIDSFEEK